MHISSKPFHIYIVQVDHLTGENIGQAIDILYKSGVSNVQVVSAITKKNRPSYMFFIDCRQNLEQQIEEAIVMELAVGGWHRIETTHCYLHNQIDTYPIILSCGEKKETFSIEAKNFIGGGIRPEHDSILRLKEYISVHFNRQVDYNLLYAYASATSFPHLWQKT